MGEWLIFTFALTGRREWGMVPRALPWATDLLGFQPALAPQTFAECSRSASCCYVATLFDQKYCRISLNITTMKNQKKTPPV